MKHRQWLWQPRKWHVMLTIGHGWGFGFIVLGRNGTDIWFGPAVLSLQAPMPAAWFGPIEFPPALVAREASVKEDGSDTGD